MSAIKTSAQSVLRMAHLRVDLRRLGLDLDDLPYRRAGGRSSSAYFRHFSRGTDILPNPCCAGSNRSMARISHCKRTEECLFRARIRGSVGRPKNSLARNPFLRTEYPYRPTQPDLQCEMP